MNPLTYAKLSAQTALLGSITISLRAVTIDIDVNCKKLIIYFFYDGEISDELFDLASVAITEISADLPDYELDDHIERLDYPNKILIKGQLVYLRRE